MSKKHPKILMQEAAERVSSASYCPKKLTAIHAGIAAGASLLVALLTYLLGIGIDDTAGLGGINSRAALETAQTVLQMVISILSPFWALGFVSAALHLSRGQMAAPNSLLTGFRRWGAALRLMLLEGVLVFGIMLVTMQIGSYLFLLSPLSEPFTAFFEEFTALSASDPTAAADFLLNLDQQTMRSIFWRGMPFLAIPTVAVLIPLSYRLRLAQYILLDQPKAGAMLAMMLSFRLMKKQGWKLFGLDLRLWWFHGLEMLVVALCYGDLLLPMLGVELGMNAVLLSFLCYALALICQVGLYVWKKPQVMTAYALFYDDLLPRQMPEQESAN